MEKITIKQASALAGVSAQQLRVMIQNGVIEGAKCWGPKHRRTYYVTDAHMDNFLKGGNR